MKKCIALVMVLITFTSLFAQQPDTLIKKLDSLSRKTDSGAMLIIAGTLILIL